jgi:hypothetical protein
VRVGTCARAWVGMGGGTYPIGMHGAMRTDVCTHMHCAICIDDVCVHVPDVLAMCVRMYDAYVNEQCVMNVNDDDMYSYSVFDEQIHVTQGHGYSELRSENQTSITVRDARVDLSRGAGAPHSHSVRSLSLQALVRALRGSRSGPQRPAADSRPVAPPGGPGRGRDHRRRSEAALYRLLKTSQPRRGSSGPPATIMVRGLGVLRAFRSR